MLYQKFHGHSIKQQPHGNNYNRHQGRQCPKLHIIIVISCYKKANNQRKGPSYPRIGNYNALLNRNLIFSVIFLIIHPGQKQDTYNKSDQIHDKKEANEFQSIIDQHRQL